MYTYKNIIFFLKNLLYIFIRILGQRLFPFHSLNIISGIWIRCQRCQLPALRKNSIQRVSTSLSGIFPLKILLKTQHIIDMLFVVIRLISKWRLETHRISWFSSRVDEEILHSAGSSGFFLNTKNNTYFLTLMIEYQNTTYKRDICSIIWKTRGVFFRTQPLAHLPHNKEKWYTNIFSHTNVWYVK